MLSPGQRSSCNRVALQQRLAVYANTTYPRTVKTKHEITRLLHEWTDGSEAAGNQLAPLVYDELHRMAERLFRRERAGHTLQPTVLVNDLFANLVDADIDWQDRAHFFALAARMMRRLLVNHANARRALKRGGDALKITLDEGSIGQDTETELLNIEEALQSLAEIDERKATLIELQYFGGLSFREMEAVTGLSSSTIDRDLRLARAWLKDTLTKN